MRPLRALVALGAAGVLGVWLTGAPATAPHTDPVSVAVPATSTTVAVPTSTVVAVELDAAPHQTVQRASRGARRPVVAPGPDIAAGSAGDCGAWGWRRTRADLDRCWRHHETTRADGSIVSDGVDAYADWPADRMLSIMWCESRGDPWAKNPRSSAAGLFQILGASQGDGPGNIAVAHGMWANRGTTPWRACGG